MRVFDLLKSRIDKMEEKRDMKGLILALKDDDEVIRQESARALGNIGSKEAIEPLTQTLQDPDKGVREEAITALGKIGNPQATPQLINALNSQYISIRWRAAQALGKIGSPEAIEPLTQTLQDPDKRVKEEAITALGRITISPYLKDLESNDKEAKERAINEINQPGNIRIPGIINNKESSPLLTKEESPISTKKKISPIPNKKVDSSKPEVLVDNEEAKQAIGEELDKEAAKEEEPTTTDSEVTDFRERVKELKEKGYYTYMKKFVASSKYDYQENFTLKTGYNYQLSDLDKLKKLLEYKGIIFQDEEILSLIQEEIKKQEYQDFEEKIMENNPTTKKQYLEAYTRNYPQETKQNIDNLEKLFQKQKISTKNLEDQIEEIRQQKEIQEFENKLLQSSGVTTSEKDSPSILLKFIKKELMEKRDKLIQTDNYHIIENFVRTSKYDYQINDLDKLKKLLEYKELTFQNEEILWLIQEEIKNQEYQDFEEKIMENNPTTKKQYLEAYTRNYPQETKQNMVNLRKLFQKQKIAPINLEKEINEILVKKEVRDFEKKLFNELDPAYESIPVIESNVSKDKALKNSQILSNLGNLFYDLGKTDDALSYFDKALNTYPDYVDAWKNKGLIFYTMGRTQKAVTCFHHVLTLDGEYGEVWLDTGLILFEMGKIREAKRCYEKALEIQPGNLEEISSYTRQFLHKNTFYQEQFNKFLSSVTSNEIAEETSDSSSTISKIMRLLK